MESGVSTECEQARGMNEIMWAVGATLRVRPIEIADVDRLARAFERLSRESVLFRFFSPIPQLSRPFLLRLADVDHCRREALVALDGDEIVAVARYDETANSGPSGGREAEIAVTVDDAWQRRGIGRQLAGRLAGLAIERGYDAFVARILPENRAALGLMRALAPDASVKFVGGDYEARLPLTA
jgi:GNAT superfamily N-acetyltransferase